MKEVIEALEAHAAACRKAVAEGLERPQWTDATLIGADLTGVDLSGANLSGANLSGAGLSDTDLRRATLTGADLSGADLTGASLACANLGRASLVGANLFGADLSGARLTRADLSGADLTGASLAEGVACGRAISGESGADRWWAVALVGGGAVLQIGCDRHTLGWWQGLMVAITAAKALAVGGET